MECYKYIIITPEDIDDWYGKKIKTNESQSTCRKRRQRFRDNMFFPNLTYCCYIWYMGTNSSSLTILWKIPCSIEDRDEEKQVICIAQSMKNLPEFSNRKEYFKFYEQYKYAMGASVPKGMLKHMYKVLTKDARIVTNKEHDERILKYCLSKGEADLWPDLRAANNGSKEQYSIFYEEAQKIIDEISTVDSYRNNDKKYISSDHKELTSIPAFHNKIVTSMQSSSDKLIKNASIPSMSLLRISLCPQYESRLVSEYYTC